VTRERTSAAKQKRTSLLFSDEALRFGAEAHYLDAAEYEQTYRRRRIDVRFYVSLAERRKAETVLELGAGSGRVARALARSGVSVVGVEVLPEMVAHARALLGREPRAVRERVTMVQADLRSLRLKKRFPLVIAPFNVLSHLYSRPDFEAAMRVVKAHLMPRGRFALDVTMPDLRAFLRDPMRSYKCPPRRDVERNVIVESAESFAYDCAAQIQLVTTMAHDRGEFQTAHLLALAHRQFFPRELEALLHYNGFVVEEHAGGFGGEPLGEASESQVIVARAR
jgi:SAM-dependent methyltransferase